MRASVCRVVYGPLQSGTGFVYGFIVAQRRLGFVRKFCNAAALHNSNSSSHAQNRKAPSNVEATLYVHWPYCKQLCTFCNFNKYVRNDVDHDRMKSCLVAETATLLELSAVGKIKSVYFGGGTPSLSQPATISAVLETVSRQCQLEGDAEVTLEANPTSVETQSLRDFKLAGVNRLSLGIQGLNDQDLRLLGRDNTTEDSLKALDEAKQLFPGRVSIDLLFGRPNQSVQDWEKELLKAISLCDNHVSLYELTLERGTPLYTDVKSGRLSLPMPDSVAEMYQIAVKVLENAGFFRYEVANFAKPGAQSQHNLSYWSGTPYIGVGPGAHGRFCPVGEEHFVRQARVQTLHPEAWMKEVELLGHATRKQSPQTHRDCLEEILMLGLRTTEGLTTQIWQQFCLDDLTILDIFHCSHATQDFIAAGLLCLDKSGMRATSRGLCVIDSILPALLLHLEQFLSKGNGSCDQKQEKCLKQPSGKNNLPRNC